MVRTWWLETGSEECEFCLYSYHPMALCHCAECDRAVCHACVIELRETRRNVCPDCHKALAAEVER